MITAFLTFCLLSSPALAQVEEFTPTFTTTKKTTHKIPKGQEYVFGYLEVLENRNGTSGKTIKLPVYIFKSRSKKPKPDPVLYTVGGPGYTSMRASKYMEYYQYLDDRDLILFEQRGTQFAQPSLDCPEWAEAAHRVSLPGADPDQSDAILAEAAVACRDRLVDMGVDLDRYRTTEIAADINDLMNVLGVDSYNLLTLSYSTKIGQVMMRDYPDKIRAVVMDSPLPLEVNYDEESVQNLREAMERLFVDCEGDSACRAAYPDLKNRFYSFLEESTREPVAVEVAHPKTGEMELFYLKGESFVQVFSNASTSDVSEIPYEINKLLLGDYSSVKVQLQQLLESPGTGIGRGMRLSVWCAEETPFNDRSVIANETTKYPETVGLSPAVFEPEICDVWGVKKAPEFENFAVNSEIPVLLISGSYDEFTPVKWAEAMLENLPNGQHLVFKGWKHGPTTNWGNPCAMKAAVNFFNDPTKKPQPECLDGVGKTAFKVD